MDWSAWEPTLREVRSAFGYPASADDEAARILHGLVPATNRWRELGAEVRNRRNLVIVGCGPGLDRVPASLFVGQVVVAADGATSRLRELGVVPHLVVTDLDGKADDLAWAARQGARMLVHAHGDNQAALHDLGPRLGPQLYGSHQVEPRDDLLPLQNPGGFTDGDRAVVVCEHLGAKAALLVGFEFDAPPSRHSHRWDPATKPRKLDFARRIVEGVHARGRLLLRSWVP